MDVSLPTASATHLVMSPPPPPPKLQRWQNILSHDKTRTPELFYELPLLLLGWTNYNYC